MYKELKPPIRSSQAKKGAVYCSFKKELIASAFFNAQYNLHFRLELLAAMRAKNRIYTPRQKNLKKEYKGLFK